MKSRKPENNSTTDCVFGAINLLKPEHDGLKAGNIRVI